MIGHDDEFVQEKAPHCAIIRKNFELKASHLLNLENGLSSIGHGGDEKSADFLRGSHNPGLKPDHCKSIVTALKGRSSTTLTALEGRSSTTTTEPNGCLLTHGSGFASNRRGWLQQPERDLACSRKPWIAGQ